MKAVTVTLALASLAPLTGCQLWDLATQDRPNTVQKEAIGDIFAHVGTVGSVVGDPDAADDEDLRDSFEIAPYVLLIAPDTTVATARRAGGRPLAATSDPGCIIAGESEITFDCLVPWDGDVCTVTGTGRAEGMHYTAVVGASGPPCGMTDLTADFTLTGTSGTGTVTVDAAEADELHIELMLNEITFCEDGLPSGGTLVADGMGTFQNQPFDGTVEVEFGPQCGLALLK
jgi:hypothetical protein